MTETQADAPTRKDEPERGLAAEGEQRAASDTALIRHEARLVAERELERAAQRRVRAEEKSARQAHVRVRAEERAVAATLARVEVERRIADLGAARLADADRTGQLTGEREALRVELARLKEYRRKRLTPLAFGAALAVVFAAGALLGTLGGTRAPEPAPVVEHRVVPLPPSGEGDLSLRLERDVQSFGARLAERAGGKVEEKRQAE